MSGSRDQNRIPPLDPERVTGTTKQLFDDIRTKFGVVPNLFRVLGNVSQRYDPAASAALVYNWRAPYLVLLQDAATIVERGIWHHSDARRGHTI